MGISAINFWLYALGVFLQKPAYICTTSDDGLTSTCSQDEICADTTPFSWEIDWTSGQSLNNWVSKFDLTCSSDLSQALPGMGYFLGMALTTTWLPALSDIYGRRTIFLIGLIVGLLCHMTMLLTHSWAVMTV